MTQQHDNGQDAENIAAAAAESSGAAVPAADASPPVLEAVGSCSDANAAERLLYSDDNPAYKLELELSDDGLLLLGSITPRQKGAIIDDVHLRCLCKKLKLVGSPCPDAISKFCQSACRQESVAKMPIFAGKPPQTGANQRMQFLAKPACSDQQVVVSGNNRADAHKSALFDNVLPGQKIAKVLPPTAGEAGVSVTGVSIAAQPGTDFEPPLSLGENVAVQNNGTEIVATTAGRIIYDAPRNQISVSDLYVIDGDVGLATGNIDFVGRVEIKHDVTMNFAIKAAQGIRIFGNVESALLESKGDIAIQGGVAGKGKGVITCGGDLSARYLDNVTVHCAGNLRVQNEIVNGNVHCDGCVTVANGAIVGGHCWAFTGIEVLELGSEAGAKTLISVGESYQLAAKIEFLEKKQQAMAQQIAALNEQLEGVLAHPQWLKTMSKAQRQLLHDSGEKLKHCLAEQHKLKQGISMLRKQISTGANAIIHVRKCLYPNVHLYFGTHHFEVKQPHWRPMTIVCESSSGELNLGKFRPHANAEDLEKEIRHQRQTKA